MMTRTLKLTHRPYNRDELRQIARGLGDSYRQASKNILREIGKGDLTSWGRAFGKQQLDQIRTILIGLSDETRAWAQATIPTLYKHGLWVSDGRLMPGGISVAAHPGEWSPMDLGMARLHRETVQQLAEELVLPLDRANTQAAQYTEDMIARAQVIADLAETGASMEPADDVLRQARELVGTGGAEGAFVKQLQIRDASLRVMIRAFAEGKTRRQASKALISALERNGITSFIDRAGRSWSMDTYAEMSARTIARRSQTTATRARITESGRDLIVIIDHAEECPLCRPYEGKVFSISGQSKKYPSIKSIEAKGYGHPNCCHAEAPWVSG